MKILKTSLLAVSAMLFFTPALRAQSSSSTKTPTPAPTKNSATAPAKSAAPATHDQTKAQAQVEPPIYEMELGTAIEPRLADPTMKRLPETPINSVGYHSEIFIGYGFASSYDILFPVLKLEGTHQALAGYRERNMKRTGALSVGYKYRFNKVASLGVTYSVGWTKGDVYWSNDHWGRVSGHHHSFAVECDFRYLTRRVVNLYSTVGVGLSYSQHKYTSNDPGDEQIRPQDFYLPDFHVTAIGIKVGGYRLGGFAELGFGYKGVLNMGAYVRF